MSWIDLDKEDLEREIEGVIYSDGNEYWIVLKKDTPLFDKLGGSDDPPEKEVNNNDKLNILLPL